MEKLEQQLINMWDKYDESLDFRVGEEAMELLRGVYDETGNDREKPLKWFGRF